MQSLEDEAAGFKRPCALTNAAKMFEKDDNLGSR